MEISAVWGGKNGLFGAERSHHSLTTIVVSITFMIRYGRPAVLTSEFAGRSKRHSSVYVPEQRGHVWAKCGRARFMMDIPSENKH